MSSDSKSEKKQKLTLKQAKLVKELPNSTSIAEAGEKAGYAYRQASLRTKTIVFVCP